MNVKRTASLLLATPALLAALTLTGCDDTGAAPSSPVATDGTTAQPDETTTAAGPVETADPVEPTDPADPADPADPVEPVEPTTSADPEPTPATEAPPEPMADPTPAPGFPEDVDAPAQGSTYGAVITSVGTREERAASDASIAEYGYTTYEAEIGCLEGAGPALDVADGTIVSHIVFPDVATAEDFVARYTDLSGNDVVGAAEVKTYCVDG